MKAELNNIVVKNETPETGKRIIEAWKKLEVDTDDFEGSVCAKNNELCIYYGIIGLEFSNFTHQEAIQYNAKIITLEELEAMIKPKRTIESITENEAVNVTSEAEDLAFRKKLHEAGKLWCTGQNYLLDSVYPVYREGTCYEVTEGSFGTQMSIRIKYKQIIPATDFLTEEEITAAQYEIDTQEQVKIQEELFTESEDDITAAIDLLKSKGYKILKPIYEEI